MIYEKELIKMSKINYDCLKHPVIGSLWFGFVFEVLHIFKNTINHRIGHFHLL